MTLPRDPYGSAELAQSASNGNREALEALLQRFLPDVRAFLRLRTGPRLMTIESPDDLVQSVCREALGDLSQVEYRSERAFKNWLLTTALNKVREKGRFYAAQKRDAGREWGACSNPQMLSGYVSLISPSRVAIGREEVARCETAFDQLPDDYREIITLHRLLGLSYEEIAEQMGRSVAASRVLLHRALARLARVLGASANSDQEKSKTKPG